MAEHLWRWFLELDAARYGSMGPEPIGFTTIEAWARLRGIALEAWELSALRRMDTARLAVLRGAQPAQRASSTPMTPALFGAMFG